MRFSLKWRHLMATMMALLDVFGFAIGCSSNDTPAGPSTGQITNKVLAGDPCDCGSELGSLALVTNAPGVVMCQKNPANPSACSYMSQPLEGFACGAPVAPGFSPTTTAADGTTLYCCGGVLMKTNVCSVIVDAGSDTASDASSDSTVDATSDTGADSATTDANDAEVSTDATSDADAGADALVDANDATSDAATDGSDAAEVSTDAMSDTSADATDATTDSATDSLVDAATDATDSGDAADVGTDSADAASDSAGDSVADVSDAASDSTVVDATTDSTVTDSTTTDSTTDTTTDVADTSFFTPDGAVCTGKFPAAPTIGFQIAWELPSGYVETGTVEVQGNDSTGQSRWCPQGSPGFPFCTPPVDFCAMSSTDGCLYSCTFSTPVTSGAVVTFNIPYARTGCGTNNASWAFDLSNDPCGGHGASFGDVYVGMKGTWNLCSTAAGSTCQIVSPDGSLYEWARFTAP